MSKFHINKHGVPAPCKAKKGNCPYGGESGNDNHFDTQEEAQAYADKANASEHGYLPEVNSEEDESYIVETEHGIIIQEGDYVYKYQFGDDLFDDELEAMEHIREVYYAGSAHEELLRDDIEEVQVTREMLMEQDKPYESTYQLNDFAISRKAASRFTKLIDKHNVKEVFDNGFKYGKFSLDYNANSFYGTPIDLKAEIKKIGDNEYQIKGEFKEYSMFEDDFDTIKEFKDYINDNPDTKHDVNLKFTGDELKDILKKEQRFSRYDVEKVPSGMSVIAAKTKEEYKSIGAISTGLYDLSRESIY
ncbi:MAG TPA: hypothetical protein GXZ90_04400 [Clostridiales bacterium]|nr:hypothetical protein [Clostridiales bacterium]